jgi:hypothetical protein
MYVKREALMPPSGPGVRVDERERDEGACCQGRVQVRAIGASNTLRATQTKLHQGFAGRLRDRVEDAAGGSA